jgi:hypothetical protein
MNRSDFQRLARTRLQEARVLLSAGYFKGSYYLGGYAIECALKPCIAKNIVAEEIPDRNFGDKVYTHNLDNLLKLAGLDSGPPLAGDPDLDLNWATVRDWSEQARYDGRNETEATELIGAIDDTPHGVLTWLQQHW